VALHGDRRADGVVVGGGITGASVSELVIAAGLSVIALDRGGFVQGSIPASTALLQVEIDRPLSAARRAVGRARSLQPRC